MLKLDAMSIQTSVIKVVFPSSSITVDNIHIAPWPSGLLVRKENGSLETGYWTIDENKHVLDSERPCNTTPTSSRCHEERLFLLPIYSAQIEGDVLLYAPGNVGANGLTNLGKEKIHLK